MNLWSSSKIPGLSRMLISTSLMAISLASGPVISANRVPAVPAAPVVIATQHASLQVDNNHNDLADPGDTLRYTITISNNGDATADDVVFTETLDLNTLFVDDSARISPLVLGDSYVVTQSTPTRIDAPGVLGNDAGLPDPWVIAFSGPTDHGSVSISADGSFTYTPAADYNGLDSFTYTAANGIGSATALVSLTVDILPAVIGTMPANGAIVSSASANAIITFNQSVSLTASAFAMECPSGTPVPLSVLPAPPGNTVTYTLAPQISLGQGVICQVTVVAGQVQQSKGGMGHAMSDNYVFTFQTPSCSDGVKNGNETDVDCGGSTCGACGDNKGCLTATDCQSGLCNNNKCSAPTCSDGVKNGRETDIDCGGGTCPNCGDGKACQVLTDCQSSVCTNHKCSAPSCTDGVKNGTETAVDCGGSCIPCGDGKACLTGMDCQSKVCTTNHVCSAPTCTDGVKNGTETAVDCGGSCIPCGDGKACLTGMDCQSKVCSTNHVCSAPVCSDGVKNGRETDIDCGGGTCPNCTTGHTCLINSDCVSGHCTSGVCTATLLRAKAPTDSLIEVDISTLPAGQSIIIIFDVVIRAPLLPGATQVSNQGTVSGSNFAAVFTNDPDTPAPNDPTIAKINVLLPEVTDPDAPFVGGTTAILGGNVASDGGSTITGRGAVVAVRSINNNPFIGGAGVTQLSQAGSTGTFTTSATSLLPHTVYAYRAYAINAVGTGYSISRTFTTEKAGSAVRLRTSANPGYYGFAITFTASVTSTATITPGGLVTFRFDHVDVARMLNTNGIAAYITSTLPIGTHAITATYAGDDNFEPASNSLSGGQMILEPFKAFMPIIRR